MPVYLGSRFPLQPFWETSKLPCLGRGAIVPDWSNALTAQAASSLPTRVQTLFAQTISFSRRSPGLSNLQSQSQSPIGYALEGSMFTTGACIQWLRDGLGLIQTAAETESLATKVNDNGGVYFVPALSGLGAPHWDMSARGAFLGITGGVQREHLVRSVLEAIAFQVKEVVRAINEDCAADVKQLKVDGGACENNFLMQFQADVLGIPVERPVMRDSTVQGAAFAAGLVSGFWESYAELIGNRPIDRILNPLPR